MASRTSQLAELIRTGSALQVEQFLTNGYKAPNNPLNHPILEIFYHADPQHPSGREMEEKLLAFLRHGLDPNWALPTKVSIPKAYRFLASAGLPRNMRGESNPGFEGAPLIVRAAGAGRVGMVKLLLKYGAKPLQGATAVKAACDNNHPDALFALIEAAGPNYPFHTTWGQATPDVIMCAYKNKQPHILREWEQLLPEVITPQKREGLLGPLSKNRHADHALAYWMKQSPLLWQRLHDLTGEPSTKTYIPSLWPNALRLAVKEGPRNELFTLALSSDRTWLSTPISTIHVRQWSIGAGKKGVWGGSTVALPPLQTLLHNTDINCTNKDKNFVGSAKALLKRGATPWVGELTPDNSPTEAMLVSLVSGRKPSADVFRKRPYWMAPHPTNGADVFSACLNTKQADFWIAAGASLQHIDHHGNQSMAALISRACDHSTGAITLQINDPVAWSIWVCDGWENRGFPTQGFAYGQDIAQWATFNQDTYKTYKRMAGKQHLANPTHFLHASLRNLCGSLSVELLNKGADPLALDAAGWNGFHYLADWARTSMNGHQENALTKILSALEELHVKNPHLWADAMDQDGVDPWQVMTQDKDFHILINPIYHGCRQQVFTRLHEARCQKPSLWKKEDAKSIITGFYQEEYGTNFEKFIDTLPLVMLDDLLLSLFNPQRWPEVHGGECYFVRNGRRMAEALIARGANPHGRDLLGNTLGELWPEAIAAESGMDAAEENDARDHSVARMDEMKALYEAQKMEQLTPTPTSKRSIRL